MRVDRQRPLRVLAADDSKVMQQALRTIFELHAADVESGLPRMELCGIVQDGIEALAAVNALAPDVLVLDMEMPRLNGIGVLRQLEKVAPGLPVILCSASTARGARTTFDALALGARDYVTKPGPHLDSAAALNTLLQQLLPKIALFAGSRARKLDPASPPGLRPGEERSVAVARLEQTSGARRSAGWDGYAERVEIVVIGVSTGGPSALEATLPALVADFAVPVMVVQHMPKLFTGALADRLNRTCRMPVLEARDGAELRPGTVWLAPGDAHMEVSLDRVIKLHQGLPVNGCRPSVDRLFRSAAASYGSGTLAVVMTGMGSDGLEGSRRVRHAGGTVLVQDKATSAVWGMPGRVAEEGLATAVVPLPDLAAALMDRVKIGRVTTRWIARAKERTEEWREETYGMF